MVDNKVGSRSACGYKYRKQIYLNHGGYSYFKIYFLDLVVVAATFFMIYLFVLFTGYYFLPQSIPSFLSFQTFEAVGIYLVYAVILLLSVDFIMYEKYLSWGALYVFQGVVVVFFYIYEQGWGIF